MEQQAERRTSALAVWSIILSFLPLGGFLALILGILAKARIADHRDRLKGDGLAIAGMILGGLNIVATCVLAMVAAIAIPSALKFRERSVESKVKANADTVQMAVEEYAGEHNGEHPYSASEIPTGVINPFTKQEEAIREPGFFPGGISYEYDEVSGVYVIRGYGKNPTSGESSDGVVVTLQNDEIEAKEGKVRNNSYALQEVVEAYAREHRGAYPKRASEIPAELFPNGSGTLTNPFSREEKAVIDDPARGGEFLPGLVTYEYDRENRKYIIRGYGESEESGEEGDGIVIALEPVPGA
jgi:type II secretory pathway pseudopilin PulG